MNATSEGKGIRCTRCGGTFPLATLAPGAICPYCGARQEMNATAVVEAQRYRRDVFEEMRAADRERGAVSAWGQWSGNASLPLAVVLFSSLMFVVPLVLAIPSYLVAFGHLQVPPALLTLLGSGAPICATIATVAATMGFVAFQMRRTRAAPRTGPSLGPGSKVACPHCGAPSQLVPGQHVATCAHCRGALVPSRTVMIAGLDAARTARRQASLERYRTERRGMLNVASYTGAWQRAMPLVYVLAFAPMVLGVCVLPFGAMGGHVSLPALLFVGLPLLFVAALAVGGAAFYFVRARQRRRAERRTLEDLAAQFRGRAIGSLEAFVGWLDACWAGPYDTRFVGAGPRFGGALIDAFGYPAAVVLNPTASRGPGLQIPTHVRVLIAAWVPSASDGGPPPALGPEAERTMAWLRAAGFLVSCEEGGLLAMAQAPVVEHLRRHPEAAHQLAPVIGHLARLAHEVGAQPAGVTPGLQP
ncbi:MAG: hypothetical protein KC619_08550 [Myxococcales bacterium]|nr:hypothetical protein [Myxococcales bacterium]